MNYFEAVHALQVLALEIKSHGEKGNVVDLALLKAWGELIEEAIAEIWLARPDL